MTTIIRIGDCREVLRTLESESVHCVVTSPPYWGLRDYGIPPTIWDGDPACEHEWGEKQRTAWANSVPGPAAREGGTNPGKNGSAYRNETKWTGPFCRQCAAWRGTLGLEPTYQLYVEHAVEVFREVRRVLHKDGTVWLNLGDSYATGTAAARKPTQIGKHGYWENPAISHRIDGALDGLKPKDLCGIPWRVAFALQADGWYLRQDIIWSKPNPMPESVTDRCTKAHEYLFLLSKSARYYYDAEAIAEDAEARLQQRLTSPTDHPKAKLFGGQNFVDGGISTIRNKRSVWEIVTAPFPEAHFATFPPALIEPCIKAGTSEKGCCAKCGSSWVRDIERDIIPKEQTSRQKHLTAVQRKGHPDWTGENSGSTTFGLTAAEMPAKRTIGWSPSCTCNAVTIPCTVLDPFGGAGTTGLVADRLGRNAVLIELNPEYAAMAERRVINDGPLFARVESHLTE